ncbi:MAG: ABC-F family ATP-binding cassette domain-containing protein [Planctomycetes bacterium]|nr:ABC-F family ATP-binding cassette domain-containing protein [Planctomycetota bacterium]
MISLNKISMHHGSQVLFVDASLQLDPGEKVGLVGPNGSGKSTLFRVLCGEESPDEGDVSVPKRVTIGYFRQDPEHMSGRTVIDEAMAGSGRVGALHEELETLEHALADPDQADRLDKVLERFSEVQEEYQALGGYELESRSREVLAGLGFRDEVVEGSVDALSGGWKMRLELAKILLTGADVLLLDEPTNHLDIESILWLENYLAQTRAALLMTCHDRDFMNRVVKRIIEIDGGELTSYGGDYTFYEREREVRETQREAAYQRQQAMLAKMQRFIDRFGTHVAKAAQAQSKARKIEKIDKLEPPKRRTVVAFTFKEPPRSGEDVAILRSVHKAYGDHVLYDGFDLRIGRGERWCVMGENGSGKTTLLKMVAGVLEADTGEVKIGASVKMGYFAQEAMERLTPEKTVWEHLDEEFPIEPQGVKRNLLGAFQFPGDTIDKPVRVLSGGERSRLVLALMLFDPPNFLVLDEPTNHLDLLTKQMLVQTLSKFQGTMLFVSHDRTFLRGLANRVLDVSRLEHDPQPRRYEGSYEAWVEKMGTEAPGVHR